MMGERNEVGLPRISVVTPSYNQAEYLERTICSVLDQGYPNLEYIIIDGGSNDGSIGVIRKYERYLAYWVSERDSGQAEAINKGLKRATGDWVAWQNSDDIYYPGAFKTLAEEVANKPAAGVVIGDMALIDEEDRSIRDIRYVRPTKRALLAEGMVLANQAAFWRRSLHARVGYLREDMHYCFDYEWFLRLLGETPCTHVRRILGALRLHSQTKTSTCSEGFLEEQRKVLAMYGGKPNKITRLRYAARRAVLMCLEGQCAYVCRGLTRRLLFGGDSG